MHVSRVVVVCLHACNPAGKGSCKGAAQAQQKLYSNKPMLAVLQGHTLLAWPCMLLKCCRDPAGPM